MVDILEVAPRETAGRDTISRMNLQFQAAAYAALAILEDADVERVYCDWHDDFVVRKKTPEGAAYHFHQVKTKRKLNEPWTLLEVFALKKRAQGSDSKALKEIEGSFAGKLFVHTLTFGNDCHSLTLLTNVQFKDDVMSIVEEMKSGKITSKEAQFLIDKFPAIFELASAFDTENVLNAVKKMQLEPGAKYVSFDQNDFCMAARDAIHRYSEIDLTKGEISDIAQGLIELINRRSFSEVIAGMNKEQLDDAVGVGINDLLAVLSISVDAYNVLRAGGDPQALKSASVIQRTMKASGASDKVIEYMSQQKVQFDLWLRTARHSVPPYDLELILELIDSAQLDWTRKGGAFADIDPVIVKLLGNSHLAKVPSLTNEIVLGGILAALVRRKAHELR